MARREPKMVHGPTTEDSDLVLKLDGTVLYVLVPNWN